ncbi:MAG: response regulator [Lachnospiraceae bacterium]|nr:response regulator [Lachnospiraceae bacterium]MBR6273596.1 response regulator [Lachnospiraceae bacterium]
MTKEKNRRKTLYVTIIGTILIAAILILGTIWSGQKAKQDTESAVSAVSQLYLDELTERREQVVASALKRNISNLQTAVEMMTDEDLSDISHLQAYQARMKKLYTLEKFAFVDTEGLFYTSLDTQNDIENYNFDYQNVDAPFITLNDPAGKDKKVIIGIPLENHYLEGKKLLVCFMEINMDTMLEGVSLQSESNGTTFCNIYTKDGNALTNMVLGGLASEDNLLAALENAKYDEGYSAEKVKKDFEEGNNSFVSFTYNGVYETLSYMQVEGTDWMLSYLIRESVISDKIGSVSNDIVIRSLILTIFIAVIMLVMFTLIFIQNKRAALQHQFMEQEKLRTQLNYMITALASDYRSVYFADLDSDQCICYRSSVDASEGPQVGDEFSFKEAFTRYANDVVAESYREGFLQFIDPTNIRNELAKESILVYRYLIVKNGEESYEMLRIAGVRKAEDRTDHIVHAIGVGFTDIDAEMRDQMIQSQALSDALAAAKDASKAKTAFLSSMSHEIRTPMNAIIGLDGIALNDPDISAQTREYLEKIGVSANHLLSLINDILDMSRIESGRLTIKNEEFSFSKLLEQINTMFSSQSADKGLFYNCHIKGSVDDYYIGDSMKLKQVLINIIGNAVKFTGEGGTVDLTVERTAQFDGHSTLRFIVADTGIGVSKEYLPHIFDSFSQEDSSATSKYGSSGLGLAITKNIVEMMNGNIEVKSEKGKGTVFTVVVTLMDADRAHDELDDEVIHPSEMSVLVVDDDPVACEHAKLVLEKIGIACELAYSGMEAIEMVKLRHARSNPYNLILVDLKMPDMDGVETTREIRKIIGHETAIIIITAYRWDDVLEDAVKAGVDSFIAKPLFANNIIDEFRVALRRRNLEKKAKPATELKGRHLLLAEDVQINAEIMTMVLSMKEITCDLAENGRIAVDKFIQSKEGYYDAILMDIRMPEMDGLEATQIIRNLDRSDAKTVPIIALTANAFDEDVQRSLQAGMNAHLSKPIDNDALFAALENLIKP